MKTSILSGSPVDSKALGMARTPEEGGDGG